MLRSEQGLQRQISLEEQRGRERLADLAEGTSRSMSEQQQRLKQIAGQGLTRIQKTRDNGIGKISAVHQAAVEVRPSAGVLSHCMQIQTCNSKVYLTFQSLNRRAGGEPSLYDRGVEAYPLK